MFDGLSKGEKDYSFNYFGKQKEDESYIETKKQQYNPYVNNSGTVLCKLKYKY
jgi:hypothetical protein